MVKVWEVLRNTKVQLIAAVSTVLAAVPTVVAWVSSSKGITGGENAAIAWSMTWAYLPAVIIGAALVANASWLHSVARTVVGDAAADWRAWRQDLAPARRRTLTPLSAAFALVLAALAAALALNCYGLVETKARYAARLVSHDFRNRQMILARQYMEGFQLHEAARVYQAVHAAYQDQTAGQRLNEIERRYRSYRLLSSLSGPDEVRAGPTPENAYREATAYLLSPFEPDTNVRLQRYREAFRNASAAKARMDAHCSAGTDPGAPAARRALALLVEPEFARAAARSPMRWYCAIGRGGLDGATLSHRWRTADIERLLALRNAAADQDIVCPGAAPRAEDEAPYEEQGDGDAEAGTAKRAAEISAYARGQYDCPAEGAGSDSVPSRVLRFLVPGTRRET